MRLKECFNMTLWCAIQNEYWPENITAIKICYYEGTHFAMVCWSSHNVCRIKGQCRLVPFGSSNQIDMIRSSAEHYIVPVSRRLWYLLDIGNDSVQLHNEANRVGCRCHLENIEQNNGWILLGEAKLLLHIHKHLGIRNRCTM